VFGFLKLSDIGPGILKAGLGWRAFYFWDSVDRMSDQKTPESVEAIAKLAWDSGQRIAMQIAVLPPDQQEAAFRQSVATMREAAKVFGMSDQQRDGWIDLQMRLIQGMVAEIVSSGQPQGGNA
jgi:hypothetical protein